MSEANKDILKAALWIINDVVGFLSLRVMTNITSDGNLLSDKEWVLDMNAPVGSTVHKDVNKIISECDEQQRNPDDDHHIDSLMLRDMAIAINDYLGGNRHVDEVIATAKASKRRAQEFVQHEENIRRIANTLTTEA